MRFIFFFCLSVNMVSVSAQNLDWAFNIGGYSYDFNYDVETDNQGNIFVAGEFTGPVDFDPGTGNTTLIGDSMGDAFVAKYDSNMNFLWVKHIQSSGEDWASSLKADNVGNLIVTGLYTDTVHFLGTTVKHSTAYPGWNVFVVKYSPSGTIIWSTQYGGRGSDESYHIEIGNSGDIYISGMIQDSVKFNSGTVKYQLPGWSGYVARFDSNGVFNKLIWMGAGGGLTDTRSVKIDASGNIYCTGAFWNKAYFDSGLQNDSLVANSSSGDIYVAKYSDQGLLLWAIGFGSTGNDFGQDLILDSQGDIVLTGNFTGTVDFDPGASTDNLTTYGDHDIFLAKYDNSGNHIWAKKIGGSQEDWGVKILNDNNGLIYLTGYFFGTSDFDPSDNNLTLTSSGNEDVFLSSYNTNGDLFWAQKLGASGTDYGVAFSLDPNGAMILNGGFESTVDFDFSSSTSNVTSQGLIDCFVARYHLPICKSPSQPSIQISSDTVCEGDSVYLSISPGDSLYGAQFWALYSDSCNGNVVNSSSNGMFGFIPQSSSTYYLRAEGGCVVPGSCSNSTIVVNTVNTNVSNSGMLTALALNVGYQWFDCTLQTIISGESSQIFNPSGPGFYSVIITDGNCIDTSDCHEVAGIGINENDALDFNFYPNPNQGILNIDLDNLRDVSIKLYSSTGQLVYFEELINTDKYQLEFNAIPGIYILEFGFQDKKYRYKILKEQ